MFRVLMFICTLSLLTMSCGSDDSCTAEMVVGSYVGTSECDDPDSEGPTSIVVTQRGDNLILTDQDGFEYEVRFDGCDNNIPKSSIEIFGISVTYSGEVKFSGDMIDLKIVVDLSGLGVTECSFVGTRR